MLLICLFWQLFQRKVVQYVKGMGCPMIDAGSTFEVLMWKVISVLCLHFRKTEGDIYFIHIQNIATNLKMA